VKSTQEQFRALSAVTTICAILVCLLASCSSSILEKAGAIKVVDRGYFQQADAWVDGTGIYSCGYDMSFADLQFAKSTDGGDTWAASKVDGSGDVGAEPHIMVSGSKAVIIYDDRINNLRKLAVSYDGGAAWNKTSTTVTAQYELYTDGATFYSFQGLGNDFQARTSPDASLWNGPYNVNGAPLTGSRGAIRASFIFFPAAGSVDIFYLWNGQIYFGRSTDGGVTWTNKQVIPSGQSTDSFAVTRSGGAYHVVYSEQGSSSLSFTTSTAPATIWSSDVRVSDVHFSSFSTARILIAATSMGITIVAPNAATLGAIDIIRSVDSGVTWSMLQTGVTLRHESQCTTFALVAVDASTLGMFFGNYPAGSESFCFIKSTDGGATWY
jgi:hypothetical protein